MELAKRFIASRREPSPTTRNRAPGRNRAASMKCSTPLCGTIRPTRSTTGTSGGIFRRSRTQVASTSGRNRRGATACGTATGVYRPTAPRVGPAGRGRAGARCDDRHLVAASRKLPRKGAHVALDAPEMREEPRRDLGNLHPRTSENPASRRDVPAGVGARTEERLLADNRARVDRRVDPDLHVVPHDDAELPEPCVDLQPPPYDADRGLVEAEVRDLCPRAEIAAFAQDAVADVILVGHVDAGHQDGVLHFTRVAHLRLRADRGRRPDVAVRTDLGAGPDDRRSFDVRAPPHAGARFHEA